MKGENMEELEGMEGLTNEELKEKIVEFEKIVKELEKEIATYTDLKIKMEEEIRILKIVEEKGYYIKNIELEDTNK